MAGTAPFTGVGVALVTLFDEEGEIDAPATADHAARLVDAGHRRHPRGRHHRRGGHARRRRAQRPADRGAVRRRRPGARCSPAPAPPSARQAVVLSRRAADDGADALLVLSPPACPTRGPTTSGSPSAVDIPVLAYHYPKASAPGRARRRAPPAPGRRHQGQRPATPSGSCSRPTRSPSASTPATPTLIHLAGAIGCSGAILALANVDPEGCLRAWEGDGTVQRELINGHRSNALAGIAGLKRALCALHGTSPVTRVG